MISNYLQRFEDILNAPNNSPEENKKNRITSKEKSIKAFKRKLFSDVIIKPEEVPENYWKLQEKIAIER
ncbi:MAG: hypothetical protein LBC61_03000 [Candidatus Peribacteria bacterium]|nr:hypothetical protein [Candidatus Peribacteria bacterium]